MPGQGAEQRAGQGARFHPRIDYQPQVTTTDLGVMVGKSLNSLMEAIKAGNTERLTNYLAFSSRFHRYSRRNQQLIFDQKPEARSNPCCQLSHMEKRRLPGSRRPKGYPYLSPPIP